MRVCIIAFAPKKIAPYLRRYIDLLSENDVIFDYITREEEKNWIDEKKEKNQIVVEYRRRKTSFGKVLEYLLWNKKVISILKRNHYDKLIILTAYPVILLSFFLKRKYKERFIIDIRDYSELLNNKICRFFFDSAVEASKFVVISSKGFRRWLPKTKKTLPIHNMPAVFCGNEKVKKGLFEGRKIIGYFGVVSYLKQNEKILLDFANDDRYFIRYAGIYPTGDKLASFCTNMAVKNVAFEGPFENTQKKEMYEDVALINAVYGNDSLIVTSALPNKLYDAIVFKRPIIVSKGTYLAEVVDNYSLGIAIDLNENFKDQVDEYVKSFSAENFERGANEFLRISLEEDTEAVSEILSFVRERS